jgi:hypothetical protein
MSTAQTNLGVASGLSELPLYPVLTREVGSNSSSGGRAGSRSGDSGSLPGMAKNAIRNALGWQFRSGDSMANLRSFEAALGKAFRFREVEGHTEWDWLPQSFTMQADLGEITGAQASIYRQAKVMLEQTIPILDRIAPLREAADEEDIDSIRSIIRNELNDLVSELGSPGGPRVQKIDHYFGLLLDADGSMTVEYDPRRNGFAGQLCRFRDRLGMTESRVNTVEEEVFYTDFIILTDNIASLHRTWLQKRRSFTWEDKPFFGTLLTYLARQMEVISESIRELCAALDSVYIGPAERGVVDLGSREVFVKPGGQAPTQSVDLKRIKEAAAQLNDPQAIANWKAKGANPNKVPVNLTNLTLNAVDKNHAIHLLGEIEQAEDMGTVLRVYSRLRRLRSIREVERKDLDDHFKLQARPVGLGAKSLTLDGLLSWIDSFVVKEGRELLEQGGKDGATTFACTVRKLADYVHLLLIYSAQYSTELYAEMGASLHDEPYVSTGLDFHPGLHSARVYRAIRELFTHLNTTARMAGKDNVDYRAVQCCEELEKELRCPGTHEDGDVLTAPITETGYTTAGIKLKVP